MNAQLKPAAPAVVCPFAGTDEWQYEDDNGLQWTVFYRRTRGSTFHIYGYGLGSATFERDDAAITAAFQEVTEDAVRDRIFDEDHNPDFAADFT